MLTRQILHSYSNGDYTPYQKHEFAYDQWGQCVDEHVYTYDAETGEWTNTSWVHGVLTSDGKLLQTEEYTWDGAAWKGTLWKSFEYDERGNVTLWGQSIWLADKGEWLYNYKFTRAYNSDNKAVLDQELIWNPDKGDWSGLYDYGAGKLINKRFEYTYDEQGRSKEEYAFHQQDDGTMLRMSGIGYEGSQISDEVLRRSKMHWVYDETGENMTDERLEEIEDYNPQGSCIYRYNEKTYDAWKTRVPINEQTLTYEDDGIHMRDTEHYEWDEYGTKLNYVKEHYEYDADMNCVLSDYWQGQGTQEWIPYTHFTYEYENGERTRKYCYKYTREGFVPSWGEGWDWDFTIPFEQTMFWQAQNPFPTKIDAMYSFVANGNDWAADKLVYYYTPIEPETESVAAVGNENSSLRLAGRTLTTATDASIEVYDMTGRRIAAGHGTADLSNLQSGIYVATSGTDTLKFILR